jgi:hypothetical protein
MLTIAPRSLKCKAEDGKNDCLVFGAPSQHSMPVGQEHGRTIPLADYLDPNVSVVTDDLRSDFVMVG